MTFITIVHKATRRAALRILARLFYLAGIALVLPVLSVLGTAPFSYIISLLLPACTLLVMGGWILHHETHNMRRTFFSLGMMTLVPGIAALLFSIVSPSAFFSAIHAVVPQATVLSMAEHAWLDTLPRVHTAIAVYLAIGVFMLIGSRKARVRSV